MHPAREDIDRADHVGGEKLEQPGIAKLLPLLLAIRYEFESESLEPLHRSIILLVLFRLKLWRRAVRAILPRREQRGLPRDWVILLLRDGCDNRII